VNTCGDSTTKQTDLVQRSFRINFCNRNSMHNCVLAESRCPHEVIYCLAICRKPWFAVVEHHTHTCGWSDFATKVGLSWFTKFALLALCLVARNYMISCLYLCDSFANTLHYPALVLVSTYSDEDIVCSQCMITQKQRKHWFHLYNHLRHTMQSLKVKILYS